MRVLAPLALWMHELNPGVGLVKREDLRRKLVAIDTESGEPHPDQAARQFLADVRDTPVYCWSAGRRITASFT